MIVFVDNPHININKKIFNVQMGDSFGQRIHIVGQSIESLKKAYASLGDSSDKVGDKIKNVFKSISVAHNEAAREMIVDSFNWGENGSFAGNANRDSITMWRNAVDTGDIKGKIKAFDDASDSVKEYIENVKESEVSLEGFVEYQSNLANSLGKTAIKAKVAAVGMKILNAAMNMLIMWALQEIIQLIIHGIDELIHRQEKLHEVAEEARKQYEETVSELEAQEEALANVKAQLVALESISTPTLADQAQTEELRKQNAELAFQIEYLIL